jgi:hypothetical protein
MWLVGYGDQVVMSYLALTAAMVVTLGLIGARWRQFRSYSIAGALLAYALLLTAILFPLFVQPHGCR